MPLYLYNGVLLKTGSGLATDENCCCGEGGATGACCDGFFGCIPGITAQECNALKGGVFKGVGSSCDDQETCQCEGTGVLCCFGVTTIPMSDCDCTRFGGYPVDTAQHCEQEWDCDTHGSCCWPTGECEDNIPKCICNETNGRFDALPCGSEPCTDEYGQIFNDYDCVLCDTSSYVLINTQQYGQCQTTNGCFDYGTNDCSDGACGYFGNNDVPSNLTCDPLNAICIDCLNDTGYSCVTPPFNCTYKSVNRVQFVTTWQYCKAYSYFQMTNDSHGVDACTGFPMSYVAAEGTTVNAKRTCQSPACENPSLESFYQATIKCIGGCEGEDSMTSSSSYTGVCAVCPQCSE